MRKSLILMILGGLGCGGLGCGGDGSVDGADSGLPDGQVDGSTASVDAAVDATPLPPGILTDLACRPGQGERLASTVTGSHVAYATCDTALGHVYVHDLAANTRVDVAGGTNPGGPTDLRFSPDGQYVAWRIGGGVWVARADATGAVVQAGTGGNLAWNFTPDSTRLILFSKAFGSGLDGSVVVVGVDGSGVVTLETGVGFLSTGRTGRKTRPDVFAAGQVTLTPDGHLVYVVNPTVVSDTGAQLVLVRLDGTDRITVPTTVSFLYDSLDATTLIASQRITGVDRAVRVSFAGAVSELAPMTAAMLANATTVYFRRGPSGGFNTLHRVPRAGGAETTVTLTSGGDWVLTPDGYLLDIGAGMVRVTPPGGTPAPLYTFTNNNGIDPFAAGAGTAFALNGSSLMRIALAAPSAVQVDGPNLSEVIISGDDGSVHARANDALGLYHAEHRVVPAASGTPTVVFDSLGGLSYPAGIPESIRGRNDWVIRTRSATQPAGTEILNFVQVP